MATGAIYQVNPSTGLIQGIAALLTGQSACVGQPLPMGYGIYNVPFDYRDRYYDTADNGIATTTAISTGSTRRRS